MAGALDRPDTSAARVAAPRSASPRDTRARRSHRLLRDDRTRWRDDDRERVLVAVRVDTDHVVHLLCKHPDRSSDSS